MEPIVLDVELKPTDWDALQRYIQGRVQRDAVLRNRVFSGLLAAVALALIYYALLNSSDRISTVGIAAVLLGVGVCWAMLGRHARRAYRPRPDSSIYHPTRFEIDATGVRAVRQHQVGVVDWRAIEQVEETDQHVFLPLDRLMAYVLPKRNIVSSAPEALVAQLRRWHAERREQSAPNVPSAGAESDVAASSEAPAATDSLSAVSGRDVSARDVSGRDVSGSDALRPAFWSAFRANLLLGIQVFFFRRVPPASIVASFDQVAALLVTLVAVIVILGRAAAGLDVEFNVFGVYTWIALLLMGLWTCALVARAIDERADTRKLLVVVLATAPWAVVATTLLGLIPALNDHSYWYAYAIVAVVLWSGILAIRAAHGSVPRSARIVLAVSLVAFASVQDQLYFDAHLWTAASDDDDGPDRPTAEEAEAIFFDQQARIDEAVDKLAPQRPGVTDLYYIGFGGDGYQRVFRREALLGRRIFADRLGTGPRSLELINDYQDRESFPLATQVALRYALSETGRVMDPNEDVLVLLLTSHGSREGGIYIRNGISWTDTNLSPMDLRGALDDAGIKWRIVIVSACYSGIFVEPLKTENTAIVTAADSTHTSFGCADDRDLTYFGEAFLQDAMPKATTLQAAFELARKDIADREHAERLTPSNPQLWVGASMAKKLAALGHFPLPGSVAPQTNE